jgi:hypothetical protein
MNDLEQPSVGTQLMALIDRAEAGDLALIDAQIAVHRKNLDALTRLRAVLALRINGRAPATNGHAGNGAANGTSGGGSKRRREVVGFLTKHGPTPQANIAKALNIPEGSMTKLINCDWFERTDKGIAATTKARNEFFDD